MQLSFFVAHILTSTWGNQFSYLSWYLTDPIYRGQGVGFRLYKEELAKLGDFPMFLDASPGKDKLYARTGFHTFRSTHRFYGKANCCVAR